MDVHHSRVQPDQLVEIEVPGVLPQVRHVVDQAHVHLSVWPPEVREERQVLAGHHASILVSLVVKGAADAVASLHDDHVMAARHQGLGRDEPGGASADHENAHVGD